MDGNGRWADKHGKSRQFGHEQGSSNVYDIFLSCIKLDINTATFFAMSSENMNRPKEETEFISILLDNSIKKHLQDLLDNQIKFTVIGDLSHLPENIKNTIEYAEKAFKKSEDVVGLKTGLNDFDKKIGGLHKSDLIIVAGRPSMGKTAFATNIASNICNNKKKTNVLFFSLEMSSEQLATRIL